MFRNITALGLLALLVGATAVHGHRGTEVYIPCGMSPGVSGTPYATLGEVEALDKAGERLQMKDDESKAYSVKWTADTKVYIDRSLVREKSTEGTVEDLRAGMRVEVKYADEDHSIAEWIKIQVTE